MSHSHSLSEAASTRRDRGIALGLFALVLVVYGMTACRTIYTGDDGDFLTAMATLGIPHPTGYPLFVLLGHGVLRAIPPLDPHYAPLKINLLTACFGAASVAMLYRFLARLVPNRFLAAGAALTLAFAPTLWQQSLSCEVYSLTCLFLATLLYMAACLREKPGDTRLLLTMAFVYGLALTNHLTMALFLPGFLVFVLMTRKDLWRDGKTLALLVLCFAVPLSLYLYLPLAARANPPVPWGDPTNWENFRAQVTGDQFHGRMFSGWDVTQRQSALYLSALWPEFGPIPLALALGGMVSGFVGCQRRLRPLALLLAYIALANIVYAVNYDVFDIYVYFLPSYFVLISFFALGMNALLNALQERLPEEIRPRVLRLAALCVLALPVFFALGNRGASDKSGDYLEEDFSANILRAAPPHAIVITSSNITFTLWYHRFVCGERTDVTPVYASLSRGMLQYGAWYLKHLSRMYPALIDTYPTRSVSPEQTASGAFLRDMLRKAVAEGTPVLIVPDPRYNGQKVAGVYPSLDASLAPYFDRVPWGICERLYLKGHAPAPAALAQTNAALWSRFQARGLDDWAHADPLQEHIVRRYAESSLALGHLAESNHDWNLARTGYSLALRLYGDEPEAQAGLARCAQNGFSLRASATTGTSNP